VHSRYIGKSIPRLEDERLLRGHGQFVDDISLPGAAEAAILRSSYAHARILSIRTEAARALPGVIEVITADEMGQVNGPLPVLNPSADLIHGFNQSPLAADKVRYVGEAVVLVIAENRYIAEDALDLIEVEYEPLPVVASLEAASAPDAPLVHEHALGNLCGGLTQGTGDVQAALSGAPYLFRQQIRIDRGSAQPMETRAVSARYEDGQLTVWTNTQRPHRNRDMIADLLGLKPELVRVIAPDVGGAFGAKGNFYPEEFLIPYAAMRLGRPIRWCEDRRENFVATTHERVQIFDVTVGVESDGRVLGLHVDFLHDLGAYSPYGFLLPQQAANHLVGPYKIPALSVTFKAIYTHCTPTAAYRGAGRPQGVYVSERTMDLIARGLGLDPAEVRRRNLVQPTEMPYDTGIASARGRIIFDTGNYPACLAGALKYLDYEGWRTEQARLRQEGRLIGIGIGNYIEISSSQPFEGARLLITETGGVIVRTGAGSQGQGHRTSLAQIAADALSVNLEQVRVEAGDTDQIEKGIGTFGSRTMIMAGGAITVAAEGLKEQALELAATMLEAAGADLEWDAGAVCVKGAPARRVTLAELGRTAAAQGLSLSATHYFTTPGMHVANGTHAAVVEVHPDTGVVTFHKYVVMHDCGVVINPLLADGQTLGALAQAIGGSLYERLVYDESGQLLTGSYMDYLLPTATEMPMIELHHIQSPTPNNPLGVKGAGEGGSLPPYAVIAGAVEDAIDVNVRELPLTPSMICDLMKGFVPLSITTASDTIRGSR